MRKNWSEAEVEAVVEDYFNMLRQELLGQQYNKTEHRRVLKERLNNRSDGSIEMKHQNISAVLNNEMGIPYINGYKPLSNYQRKLLPEVISGFLADHPDFYSLFEKDSEFVPVIPTLDDWLAAMSAPPKREETAASTVAEPQSVYIPTSMNYLQREAQNQKLGDAGEQFVINYERARLIHAGKESLAERIEQVSVTEGPSAGYDIHSFEENGTDRFIEAKTTKYGEHTPFFVTPNELEFSRKHASSYYLYRVFSFRVNPRVFSLHGYLQDKCVLKPSQFIARV